MTVNLTQIVEYAIDMINRDNFDIDIYILRGDELYTSTFINSLVHIIDNPDKIKKVDWIRNIGGGVILFNINPHMIPFILKELRVQDPSISNKPQYLNIFFCDRNIGLIHKIKIIDIYNEVKSNSEYFQSFFTNDPDFLQTFDIKPILTFPDIII